MIILGLDQEILCRKRPAHEYARFECLIEYLFELLTNEFVLVLTIILVFADISKMLPESSIVAIRVVIVIHITILIGIHEILKLLLILLVGIHITVTV